MVDRRKQDHKQPRLSNEDRIRAVERLDTALREDRLDLVEYDQRVRAVEQATTHDELNAQLGDLPDRPGIRHWTAGLRVRGSDRQHAVLWLADALAEGTLTPEEHEQRLESANAAVTYKTLREALDGVPGPSYAKREQLLVTAGDRMALAGRLDRALADGRLGVDDHADLEAALVKARRYGEFDQVCVHLDQFTEVDVRERAIRRLDDARAVGLLFPAEHEKRVAAVRAAKRNADIPPLLADLDEPSPDVALDWVLSRPEAELSTRRITDATRQRACVVIERALRDGRISLEEYDERVRLAMQAKVAADLRPLLVDLVKPAPTGPVGKSRPTVTSRVTNRAANTRPVPKGPRRGPRWRLKLFLLGLVAVLAGCWAANDNGWLWFDQALTEVWSAPRDRSDAGEAIGNWATDDALIRARPDRVVAYDAGSGQQRWVFQPPDGHRVCAMSRATGRSVGLVGYGSEEVRKGCGTVAAIDLKTGEVLWRHERRLPPDRNMPMHAEVDSMAAADQVAVLAEVDGFVGIGMQGEGEWWRVPAGAGCVPYSANAAGEDVVLTTMCADKTSRLIVTDPKSGHPRWQTSLRFFESLSDFQAPEPKIVVLSLRPLVVRVPGEDGKGTGAFVSFDDQGKRRATIPLLQNDELALASADFTGANLGFSLFDARPSRRLAVVGDTLVVPQRNIRDSSKGELAGYSLADGRRLWHNRIPGDIEGIGTKGDRVFVVTCELLETHPLAIYTLSVRSGEELDVERVESENVGDFADHEFMPIGDRYLVSAENGVITDSPAVLLRRRSWDLF